MTLSEWLRLCFCCEYFDTARTSFGDPPRMAGSCGVAVNDSVFGMSSGSLPCGHPGQRPMQPKLRFHLHLHNRELEIQLHNKR